DDGPESDAVISLLKDAGVGDDWTIQPPNGDTNAIFIPIPAETGKLESSAAMADPFKKAQQLLQALERPPIDSIKALSLSVAMRIVTSEFYLPLPEDFVRECGRLGLEICIFNSTSFAVENRYGAG